MASEAVLILAAGRGTRMRSERPKVLHEAGGRSLLANVLAAAQGAGVAAEDTAVVVGFGAAAVGAAAEAAGASVIVQEPQRGTGDAVRAAAPWWRTRARVAVLHGDMPLLSAGTVAALLERQRATGAAAVLATAAPAEPRAYGRILRDAQRPERILAVVEERQANAEQRRIRELNAGFYCFASAPLERALGRLQTNNPHGEYYLTDTVAELAAAGETVLGLELGDAAECLGVNDRVELAAIDRRLRRAKVEALMRAGVTVEFPDSVVIDAGVEVGADSVLECGVQLRGRTRIGGGCRIRAYAILEDCELGANVLVRPHCVLEAAQIGAGAQIGPFTRLRAGARIGEAAHVGNFVEVKQTQMGAGAKANHLAYLGDAEIGERVNVGAGTITCNYDGRDKHATRIGAGSFIGSNATLVAPLEIGAEAFVAAGSVITEAVPEGALALGRARQVVKPGWAGARRRRRS